jgi:Sporulation and spore germination
MVVQAHPRQALEPSLAWLPRLPAFSNCVVIKSALALAGLTVVALAFASTASPIPVAKTHVVSIYAPRGVGNDCARVLPLKRTVAAPALLRGAMQALLAGPTKAERARGYRGWFSAKTAGHLRSVRIAGGVAFIDFRNFAAHIPNASSSCGSTLLLAQLDHTAKQFTSVKRTVYSFNGSRHAFYEWLQREAPEV